MTGPSLIWRRPSGRTYGAPVIRLLLDRVQPRHLLAASLTATSAAYFLLFTSSSLTTALPAAVAVGMFGSMSLVIPQTAVQSSPGRLPGQGPRPSRPRLSGPSGRRRPIPGTRADTGHGARGRR
jgi:hypothetical protein